MKIFIWPWKHSCWCHAARKQSIWAKCLHQWLQIDTNSVGCLGWETSLRLILFSACRVLLLFSVLKHENSMLIKELTFFHLLFSHYLQYSSFSPNSHPHSCHSQTSVNERFHSFYMNTFRTDWALLINHFIAKSNCVSCYVKMWSF